jgi:hypothetical protein
VPKSGEEQLRGVKVAGAWLSERMPEAKNSGSTPQRRATGTMENRISAR